MNTMTDFVTIWKCIDAFNQIASMGTSESSVIMVRVLRSMITQAHYEKIISDYQKECLIGHVEDLQW